MKAKKTPQADLNNKRSFFFKIGLSVSLLGTIVFFMWSQPVVSLPAIEVTPYLDDVIEMIDITKPDPDPKPLQPQKIHTLVDLINIVPNERKIDVVWNFGNEDDEFPEFEAAGSGGGAEELEPEAIDFMLIEDKPLFRGRDVNTFRNWVLGELVYPQLALETGIQGRVTLQFVIDKDGNLTQITVLASPDRSLSEEAVRILQKSERWTAGKQRGHPVPVRFTIPIDFRIQ